MALSRSIQEPDAIRLPRMGFEFGTPSYDPGRQMSQLNRLVNLSDDKNMLLSMFAPVPYKIPFDLFIMSKNMDDAAQIWEQIVPFFTPDFSQTATLIPTLGTKFDLVFRLVGQNKQDAYEGEMTSLRQAVIWTLNFEIDGWFFGPIRKENQIKRIQVDIHAISGEQPITPDLMAHSPRLSRVIVEPGLTANGTPTSTANNSINYNQITAEDDYGFIVEYETFTDGKSFNPVTLEDEEVAQ